jgi:outer membrane protein assembly factor BamB
MRDTWPMRRVLLVLAVGLAAAAAPADARAQSTTFQGGPEHAGFVRDPGLSPPLRRAWTRRLPGWVTYAVIADGRVFVISWRKRNRGTRLLALSARSGRTLWRREGGWHLGYDRGRLFVTEGPFREERLVALAPADGRVLWERLVGATSPPVAADGVVYVAPGDFAEAYRGADGTHLWRTLLNGNDAIPTVGGNAVYFSFPCERFALSRATGVELWSVGDGCYGGGTSTPVLHAGRLHVRDDHDHPGGVFYDAATGADVAAIRSDHIPAFADGLGLFPTQLRSNPTVSGHILVARSLGDWRARWRFRGDGYLDSAPLVVNRTVYVGSGSGRLYGLSLRTGRVRWRVHLRRPIPSPLDGWRPISGLAAGGGLLVVPVYRGLVAFR